MPLRRVAVAIAALCAACGDAGGPVGSPGGRDGLDLVYVTPRLRVVPTDGPLRVRIGLIVRREDAGGGSTPLPDVRLAVVREEGKGVVAADVVVTGPEGLASVDVEMPPTPDLTRVVFRMEDDAGSYLPFDIVSAPVVETELSPGQIVDRLDVPKSGAILRLRLDADADVVLMPYQTDPDRSGAAYRILFQGTTPGPAAAAFGADPPRLPQALAPRAEAGDVIEGAGVDRRVLEPAAVPQSLDIASCMVSASRKAPLRYLGTRIALYVDAPAGAHQARIDSIGRAFDESIYPRNADLFGVASDLDRNGVVFVVMTPELRDVDGVYCDSIRRVGTEALFLTWDDGYPLDRVLATLTHEHQHLINATHHVRSDGNVGDERWVNEGMSLAAEALHGYWRESLLRLWHFLNGQNGGLSMLPLDYVPAFDDRYMAFFLYLEDRYPGTLKALSTSGRRGIDNVEFVTGVDFEDLLRDWFVALAVSNRGITDEPRYTYRSVDLMGMTEEIAACECSPVEAFTGMRLEALHLTTTFDASRMLDGADADYYRLLPPAGSGVTTYDVYFDAFGREFVELALVRVR
ncbi:MAG TPA: hypothetical protein VJ788_04685 [Gemmatimonadota bacterium]|nr:hypothetical protein [Gemmatimonadota bacterium]